MRDDLRRQLLAALDTAQKDGPSSGIREMLGILDESPSDPDALHQLDVLLELGFSNANAAAQFDRSLLQEPRVAARLKVCASCNARWAPSPSKQAFGKVAVVNPRGGQCPRCHRIFCRKCASKAEGMTGELQCPTCTTGLLRRDKVALDCVNY
jgi:hypothetical protein